MNKIIRKAMSQEIYQFYNMLPKGTNDYKNRYDKVYRQERTERPIKIFIKSSSPPKK